MRFPQGTSVEHTKELVAVVADGTGGDVGYPDLAQEAQGGGGALAVDVEAAGAGAGVGIACGAPTAGAAAVGASWRGTTPESSAGSQSEGLLLSGCKRCGMAPQEMSMATGACAGRSTATRSVRHRGRSAETPAGA